MTFTGAASESAEKRGSGLLLRSRQYGIYVLGLLTTVNFLAYGSRNVIFTMYGDLRDTFGFSNSELGLLGSAFMLSHALATPLVGWAGDRFDRRRLIALGAATWSLAGVASAMALGFGTLFFSRAVVGAGTAACVPLCNALLCQVFPHGQKARTIAIFNLGLFIGGAGGFGMGTLGYRLGMLLMALPGLVAAVLVLKLDVPGRPTNSDMNSHSSFSLGEFAAQAAQLLRIPTMRWVLCGAVIMAFSVGGYQAWFFEFLDKVKGLGTGKAFSVLGFSFIGGFFGILSGGIVADRLQQSLSFGRLAAISIGMACTAPWALVVIYSDVGVLFYIASWLTMYFIMWYHGPMAAVIDDLAIQDRAAPPPRPWSSSSCTWSAQPRRPG